MSFNSAKNISEGLKPGTAAYTANCKNSVYSLGNNYGAKKVLEKLKQGKKIYVAAIGGSVTEGAGPRDKDGKELWQLGYAFKFRDKLKAKYPDSEIVFDGAGLSGTSSALGVVRYQKDIVQTLSHAPDILVIEFSVNDSGECSNGRGFEKIIRYALEENKEALVIPFYAHAVYNNTQDAMMPIADYYKLPQISVRNALSRKDAAIDLKEDGEFFTDNVHPTEEGHNLMADCLMELLACEDAAAADKEFELPEEYFCKNGFKNFKAVYADTKDFKQDEGVKINAGSFSGTDPNSQSIKKGGGEFPHNWHHPAREAGTAEGTESVGNEEFSITLKCKSLIFIYKVQGNWLSEKFGSARLFIDGKETALYDGANSTAGAWNNCIQNMIIDEDEVREHKVQVKMADGSEKLGFTILALGYSY